MRLVASIREVTALRGPDGRSETQASEKSFQFSPPAPPRWGACCPARPSSPPHSIPWPSIHINLDLKFTWLKPNSHLPFLAFLLLPLWSPLASPQMVPVPPRQGQRSPGLLCPLHSPPLISQQGLVAFTCKHPGSLFWFPPPATPPRSHHPQPCGGL